MSTEEPKIEMSVNGLVQVEIQPDHYSAEDAHEMAIDLLDAAYASRCLKIVDEAMAKQRDRYIPEQLEWRVLDAAWREIRLALGYDDNPNPGSQT